MAEEVVVKDPRFQVGVTRTGSYSIVRVRGTYSDDIVDVLRTKVFWENTSFAVDVSQLNGIQTPFARELLYTAKLLKDADHRLVLLRPPDRLRSLLQMLAPEAPLPVFLNEQQLTDDPRKADEAVVPAAREFERIRREIRSNKWWQYTDRESCWICPYCAGVQQEILLPMTGQPPTSTVEKIYKHLWYKCADFSMANPNYKTLAEIEEVRKRQDQLKVVVTRRKMSEIETQISALQDRAKKADALEQSVKVAVERQRRLLPAKPPVAEGLEISIVYRPAEHLSGDFYDFVTLPEGKLGFLIGDVSGHGIEAGILMGMAKKLIAVRLDETGDPAAGLSRANNDLFRDLDRQSFVTAFVAVYDPRKRELASTRAGHNPPVLFNLERNPKAITFERGGLGVGLTKGDAFDRTLTTDRVPIRAGDLFLLYTDGLVEAKNKAGEEFGIERVIAALQTSFGNAPAIVLSDLQTELDKFCTGVEQEDDITAVCVRFQ